VQVKPLLANLHLNLYSALLVSVHSYHRDNGVSACRDYCEANVQQIIFSGNVSHFQNRLVENSIHTIIGIYFLVAWNRQPPTLAFCFTSHSVSMKFTFPILIQTFPSRICPLISCAGLLASSAFTLMGWPNFMLPSFSRCQNGRLSRN